jgi:uncharacterized membrane protein YidH (DUF202 family)
MPGSANVPGPPGSELPENQFERTQLAWRRTMIGILAVVGIGGIHISTMNHPWMGVVAGLLSLIALIPIVQRMTELRRHNASPATWQPMALVIGMIALAAFLVVLN